MTAGDTGRSETSGPALVFSPTSLPRTDAFIVGLDRSHWPSLVDDPTVNLPLGDGVEGRQRGDTGPLVGPLCGGATLAHVDGTLANGVLVLGAGVGALQAPRKAPFLRRGAGVRTGRLRRVRDVARPACRREPGPPPGAGRGGPPRWGRDPGWRRDRVRVRSRQRPARVVSGSPLEVSARRYDSSFAGLLGW